MTIIDSTPTTYQALYCVANYNNNIAKSVLFASFY